MTTPIARVIDRRAFVRALAIAAVVAPRSSAAQPTGRTAKVGFLTSIGGSAAVLRALRETGWIEGRNLVFERRDAEGAVERYPALARDLVARGVEVIVATSTHAIGAARDLAPTTPVVGVDLEGDPVASGFVASLRHPGGNVTGVFLDLPELSGQQLQLLKEAVPQTKRIAILWDTSIGAVQRHAAEVAGRTAGLTVQALAVQSVEDVDRAFDQASAARATAVVVLTSPMISRHRSRIAGLALKHRLPSISPFMDFARAGGLMAYGPSLSDVHGRAAALVDRILRGARPADLAVERPTRFVLIVNLKAAKALGLTVPQSLLLRADEVIR